MQIALASYSLHNEMGKKTKLLDFPALVRNEFGLGAAELNSIYFASTEESYLRELKCTIDDAGLSVVNIAVDRTGNLSSPDPTERNAALVETEKWIHISEAIGSPRVRANTGGGDDYDEETIEHCIGSFKALADTASEKNIQIVMENHGGISADPDNMIRIVEGVGMDNFGTCPDFGNFPADIRYEAFEKIAKYALIAHAKTLEFDKQGNEANIDIPRCIEILKDVGFNGDLSIEFEGPGDQRIGVKKTIVLLQKNL